MLQEQTVKCLIILVIIVKCVHNLEIFVAEKFDGQDRNEEHFKSIRDKSYEIPLFQKRYITIRMHSSDLRRNEHDDGHAVGFKFQIRSSVSNIVNIRKELTGGSAEDIPNNNLDPVIVEDLYILPRKKALGHVLNAYPSPTLFRLKQKSTNDSVIESTWSIEGLVMDITNLTIRLDIFYNDDKRTSSNIWSLHVLVTQPRRIIDKIFYIILPFMVITISILMGTLLDTKKIRAIFESPKPVIVGFLAQYGLMPFLAMAIAKIFRYTPLNSLALFVIGCCPGSGASNQWTVIFDGDVNLSAVMSFVSTTASFIMMPIYFYTIGKLYMDDLAISVPFLGLARSLGMVVIPYGIGIAINHFYSKAGEFVAKLIKPMMIGLMLFFLSFGLVVNWYLFKMIDLYTTLTAPLLPFLGFFLGALLAKIAQLDWIHVKTIGIEAGIQNTGIAFMIFMYSFPQPYATQAMVVPMVVALLSTKPFWVVLIVRNQIRKYQKRKELEKCQVDGDLIISIDKPSLNNGKNHLAENIQQL